MDPIAKYISQKISKTRWRPISPALLQRPEVFATGSWDNESNRVSIWSLGDDDSDTDGEFDEEPRLLCDSEHDGDVMDLQFLDGDRLVSASSSGAVAILKLQPDCQVCAVFV